MKALVTLILTGAAALALSGCKTEFDGNINVNQATKVNLKRGTATLNPGAYASTIKFSSKKKATLIVKTGTNLELPISIPRSEQLPEENGTISWRANEIGQTFDVEGTLSTITTQTGRRIGNESCTEQVPYTECYVANGQQFCRTNWRYATGNRDIEYYDNIHDQTVALQLINPNSRVSFANLNGKNREIERIVTYSGICRVF